MISDPLDLALREIAATRHLVEALVTSSESFDYLRARATLQELQAKVRVLAKLQARLCAQQSAHMQERIVQFPALERLH